MYKIVTKRQSRVLITLLAWRISFLRARLEACYTVNSTETKSE